LKLQIPNKKSAVAALLNSHSPALSGLACINTYLLLTPQVNRPALACF
jgi:hypothetical protein